MRTFQVAVDNVVFDKRSEAHEKLLDVRLDMVLGKDIALVGEQRAQVIVHVFKHKCNNIVG